MESRSSRLARAAMLANAMLASASIAAMPPTKNSEFKLVENVKLGGEGSWDYVQVDPVRDRLYISRVGGYQVLSSRLASIGSIPAGAGTRVHGIALAEPLGLGITGDGDDRTSTIFDLKTLAVVRRVRLPHGPDAVSYDPFSRAAVAVGEDDPNLMAFDPRTGKILADVHMPGSPEAAAPDGAGHLWVTLSDTSEVAEVNSRTWRVEGHWPVGGKCEVPTPISLDRSGHRVFIGCRSKVMAVVDTDTHRLLGSVPLCDGFDALVYDPTTKRTLASCNEGVLQVVDASSRDHFNTVQTLATAPGARTMAFDAKRQRVYLPVADKGPMLPRSGDIPPRPAIVPDTFRVIVAGRE